ncbi:NAD(P)/FAD-dependent oxidoreductase [Candidatus Uhrbacteria bacterium]|nr:NAD(P)/FAD-dependent oxidoreductase [Candidatus Uhrbacteria bacterium]
MNAFDVVIIGSGSAGLAAAESAKEAGAKRVAVVESAKRLGGECPNRGCVPSKALLRSVELMMEARRAKEFGLRIPKTGFDFSALMRRKRKTVDALTGGGRMERILEHYGVDLIRGAAHFTGRHSIDVDGRPYEAKRFVIATGSEPFIPPIPGLKESGYWTSDDIVKIRNVPTSLLVIGGGPIGAEWAQILAPLGTRVTIIEAMSQLLPREDPEIAHVVETSFKRQGIRVQRNTKISSVRRHGKTFIVNGIRASALLVATGKRPAVGSLALDAAGVSLSDRDAPILNEYLQTSNPDIYVAGDAAAQMMFTHVAHLQGEIAGTNAVAGPKRASNLDVIPRGTFCSPEVGSVGLTEQEARKQGRDVAVGRGEFSYLGKSLVSGETDGLVKIVADRKTKLILGGHIVGHSAAELIHEVALAMFAKIPYTAIAEMVHAYPTYAEAVGVAASDIGT